MLAVAMAVALLKASLVALFFMHLVSEKKVIHWMLLTCFVCFVFLMLLPLGTHLGIHPLWETVLASP